MRRVENVGVTVRATVSRPVDELRPALKSVLSHLERSRKVALTVDLPAELRTPVEAALSVPARLKMKVDSGGELSLRIAAAGGKYHTFPAFWGALGIAPSANNSSVVTLRGTYTVPVGAVGEHVDKAFLRNAAHSSLRQFLESVIQETVRQPAVQHEAADSAHMSAKISTVSTRRGPGRFT